MNAENRQSVITLKMMMKLCFAQSVQKIRISTIVICFQLPIYLGLEFVPMRAVGMMMSNTINSISSLLSVRDQEFYISSMQSPQA
jgi:magnesium-transporting ATPase (P-type)